VEEVVARRGCAQASASKTEEEILGHVKDVIEKHAAQGKILNQTEMAAEAIKDSKRDWAEGGPWSEGRRAQGGRR
jgi:hypothetical protein